MFGLRKVNGNTHSFETTFQNWKEKGEDVAGDAANLLI